MDLAEVKLPVFLPGNNRDWTQVDGVATITDEGELRVKLKPEDAERLIDLGRKNILFQVSFDYRMSQEMLDTINAQGQKFSKED